MIINKNFNIIQDSGEGVGYIVIERKTLMKDYDGVFGSAKKGDISKQEHKSYFSSLYEALKFLYLERIPCRSKTIKDCLEEIKDFEKTLLDAINSLSAIGKKEQKLTETALTKENKQNDWNSPTGGKA